MNDVVAFFGELPLFEGLAAEQLEDLARMVRPFRLEPHQVLFRQGDESDGLYVIRSGAVEVSARVPGDAALTLLRVGAGELLGEVALLDRGLRSATATAVAETSGYWFGRRHFELLRADLKPTSLHLMRRLIDNTCRSVHRAHERGPQRGPSPREHLWNQSWSLAAWLVNQRRNSAASLCAEIRGRFHCDPMIHVDRSARAAHLLAICATGVP